MSSVSQDMSIKRAAKVTSVNKVQSTENNIGKDKLNYSEINVGKIEQKKSKNKRQSIKNTS